MESPEYLRAEAYMHEMKFSLALKQYKKHLFLFPEDSNAWMNMGLAYYWLNREHTHQEEALACIERGRKFSCGDVFDQCKYACMLSAVGKFEEAKQLSLELIKNHPDQSVVYWGYANILSADRTHRSDEKTIIDFFEKAINLAPEDALAIYHYGVYLMRMHPEKGIRFLKRAAKMGEERAVKYLKKMESNN